jgi:hypothetical protein
MSSNRWQIGRSHDGVDLAFGSHVREVAQGSRQPANVLPITICPIAI